MPFIFAAANIPRSLRRTAVPQRCAPPLKGASSKATDPTKAQRTGQQSLSVSQVGKTNVWLSYRFINAALFVDIIEKPAAASLMKVSVKRRDGSVERIKICVQRMEVRVQEIVRPSQIRSAMSFEPNWKPCTQAHQSMRNLDSFECKFVNGDPFAPSRDPDNPGDTI